VTVSNVAPALSVPATASTNEGAAFTFSGTVTDAGAQDAHTVAISWGDGSADTTLNLAAGGTTFSAGHTYQDDGPSPGNGTASDAVTVTVTASDDDTGTASASTTVTVNNVAPTAALSASPGTIDEGGSTTITGTVTDPGAQDAHTVVLSWGDGSADTTI